MRTVFIRVSAAGRYWMTPWGRYDLYGDINPTREQAEQVIPDAAKQLAATTDPITLVQELVKINPMAIDLIGEAIVTLANNLIGVGKERDATKTYVIQTLSRAIEPQS